MSNPFVVAASAQPLPISSSPIRILTKDLPSHPPLKAPPFRVGSQSSNRTRSFILGIGQGVRATSMSKADDHLL
ncbi:hypothetical protein TNCV_3147711 [Trichonephila clavipes]|nr:hypothetical protein TNCV_3147711 [Trichonephila clavipes]